MGWHNGRDAWGLWRNPVKLTAARANLHQRFMEHKTPQLCNWRWASHPLLRPQLFYMNHIKKEFGTTQGISSWQTAHKQQGPTFIKGSWNIRHLNYAIGDGQVTHCWDLSYFIWTTLRRNLGQLRGSARGKLLTNNEDSDTSHHPVVLGFSLSLSLSLSLFLSLSVSFQAKNSRLVSNLTFLLLPPKLLGSQLHTTEPHSSFSFYKANY